jgi:mannose-6-phosphate isomerase
VLKSEPGAKIGLGLKPGTTREQFARAIEQVRAEELLNWIEVHPGEMFYVDAGTVHAIGPGSILVETQQNSDTTYRMYDYGRPRELHVKDGLAALKAKTRAGKVETNTVANGHWTALVNSPCFKVNMITVRDGQRLEKRVEDEPGPNSAEVLVALDGCGVIEWDGASAVTVARGEAVVVPASRRDYKIRGQWNIEVLRARLPGGQVFEPETTI